MKPHLHAGEHAGFASSVAARVREFCAHHNLFSPSDRAGVMVSGGQDSAALLHLLATRSLGEVGPASVVAVHVNHHLRGEESDRDQALVEGLCRELHVELLVDHRPVGKEKGNVQERARGLRRAAAQEAAARLSLPLVALGHTKDDQVETMLYRLGRYGGLRSLRAMEARSGLWVRPLLPLRRCETEEYCRAVGLPFAVDRGNEYPGYARTGIRAEVLPAWERVLPGAVEAAARAAEAAAEALDVVSERAAALEWACRRGPEMWSVARLRSLEPALRRFVLHELLMGCGEAEVSRTHVLALESLLHGPSCASVGLGAGWLAMREYDVLWFARRDDVAADASRWQEVELPVPGETRWGGFLLRAERGVRFCAPDPAREAFFDAEVVGSSLRVRGRRPGDVVHPLGAGGARKLQDVFTDARVPRRLRDRIPVVVGDRGLLWVPGLVVAEGARIVRDTRSIVRLSVETDRGER